MGLDLNLVKKKKRGPAYPIVTAFKTRFYIMQNVCCNVIHMQANSVGTKMAD